MSAPSMLALTLCCLRYWRVNGVRQVVAPSSPNIPEAGCQLLVFERCYLQANRAAAQKVLLS